MMADAYSVSQVNSYIRNMFQTDFVLNRIKVTGEVSNCKYHSSGHIYFTLKDSGGALACVMFAGDRRGLSFQLKDGMQVKATGSINVYERDGKYQLYAKSIQQEGAGALYEKYLALKAELEEMGMFDAAYKQPIPKYATRIGVVTAATGAAIHDIINISGRRNPYVQLYLYPAKVQGEGAAQTICEGIHTLDDMNLDVIIVGRGGGSIEDLWAFNEEVVARAVFECRTPVISAVGHETDFTIIDFVSDRRAPTPSAAAELAVFDYNEWQDRLERYEKSLVQLMSDRVDELRGRLDAYMVRLNYLRPERRLEDNRQYLDNLTQQLERAMDRLVNERRHTMQILAGRLKALSPLAKISGGFGYIEGKDGHSVKSVDDVKDGDTLSIRLSDGKIYAKVNDKEKDVDTGRTVNGG